MDEAIEGPGYYDREGNPLSLNEWGEKMQDDEYRTVAKTELGNDVLVSTVWLGLDHNFWPGGAPLIFETMIFDHHGNPQYQDRYTTEVQAVAGHDQAVQAAKGTPALFE